MKQTLVAADSNGHRALADVSLASLPGERWPVDRVAAERAAADLLAALGADLHADGSRDTARRMAAAYAELLTPRPFELTTFPNEEGYDELVLVRETPFQSLCMHHMRDDLRTCEEFLTLAHRRA